jgi:UDP-glucose 4-epimerase
VKIYITGIAGFLGSHLLDYLLAEGHDAWGCDDLSTGDRANLPGSYYYYCEEIGIEDLTLKHFSGVDTVFHLAAAAYEGVSSFSPAFISRNIYAGSANVFSAAIAAGVRRIVFTSSMARYGKPTAPSLSLSQPHLYAAFAEEQGCRPVDPYGISKLAAEYLLINLCETHNVEWSIAVPHNIYGPRQRIDPYRNVATIFANRLLLGKQPIIYGDGLQTRCFSYIHDTVPSLARMSGPEALRQTINIGPDRGEVTILELGRLIAEIVGRPYDPIYLPPRPREVKQALCSSDKARRLLGFHQDTELREGLTELVVDLRRRGPRPFDYHLPLEIPSPLMPRTWSARTM